MNDDAIRDGIFAALRQVAPEADARSLEPNVDMRDELDIDSMDYLNFILGLHERFGVEIPERDYPKLFTLDGCVAYLRGALGATATA